MRFRDIHQMPPAQRMEVLESKYLPGTRTELFLLCAPNEYERFFHGVPAHAVRAWSASMTDADRKGWEAYNTRTKAHQAHEQAQLAILRPALNRVLEASPYDLDELLELPRLLGDPVDSLGVRLYMLREGLTDLGQVHGKGRVHVTEKTYPLDELVDRVGRMQSWGWAAFVAIHDIPYGERRSNAAARAARVFSADWDTKKDQYPPEELMAKYPPDLFVRSGGGYHAYWIIPEGEREGLDLTHWRRVGLALARCLNSDVDAVLGSQIMRLPGSIHLKNPAEPKKVYVLARREGEPRVGVTQALIDTFKLILRDEDTLQLHAPTETIIVDPDEHPALAVVLSAIQDQGLMPRADNKGWMFYCPCHETASFMPADLEDGEEQEYTPKAKSTPSAILRVNADRSLSLFCGSRVACGAGPRQILEALGLSKDLAWAECGGFLKSDFGQRYKAARIADGTWVPSAFELSAAKEHEQKVAAGKKGAAARQAKRAESEKLTKQDEDGGI